MANDMTKWRQRVISMKKAARMCPTCGADSEVYDSREQDDGTIVRRRKCLICGVRYKTLETFQGIISGKAQKTLDIGDETEDL